MTLCLAVILSEAKNLAREVVQQTQLTHLEDLEVITGIPTLDKAIF